MAIAHQELTATNEPANEPANESEWVRIRLALAVRDVEAGRLDGVVGHYRALCEALDVRADLPVETGLRTMAESLGRSGRRDLAEQADGLADRFLGALMSSGTPGKLAPVDSAADMASAPA